MNFFDPRKHHQAENVTKAIDLLSLLCRQTPPPELVDNYLYGDDSDDALVAWVTQHSHLPWAEGPELVEGICEILELNKWRQHRQQHR